MNDQRVEGATHAQVVSLIRQGGESLKLTVNNPVIKYWIITPVVYVPKCLLNLTFRFLTLNWTAI